MDKLPVVFAAYFAVISLVAVFITVCDKRKAIKNRRRISERSLIVIGILGGAIFEYATMKIIRHKTLHKKFMIGLPVIIAVQVAALVFVLVRFVGVVG